MNKSRPYYQLDEVRELIAKGRYSVWPKASATADADFGFDLARIADVVSGLDEKDFVKTMNATHIKGMVFDVYVTPVDLGEPAPEYVYVKFYIDDHTNELLIVTSCKRA